MKLTFGSFLISQWTPLGRPFYVDLTGKTVVIIGGNSGIGFEATKHFAKMRPARLIIGSRSEERGQAAAQDIARATGCAAEIRIIDLGDFSSVVAFADGLKDVPIDILVANAGLAFWDYNTTKDGWEEMIHVNHLGTSLASLLLIPNLVRAARDKHTTSRLVVTTSEMHMTIPVEDLASTPEVLKTLNDPEHCTPKDMETRYPLTKLFNILFVRALADRLPLSTPLCPTAVNPGFCLSNFRRSAPWNVRFMMKIMDIMLGRTSEQGSRNLLWAALGPDGKEGPHIRYLRGAHVSTVGLYEPGDNVMSKEGYELQEKLWRETIDVLSEVAPSVRSIVSEYLQ